MNTTYITATDLKKKTAEILNKVHYEKKIAVIERFGQPLAKLIPIGDEGKREDTKTLLKKYYGILPTFPDVTVLRHFRKRKITLP